MRKVFFYFFLILFCKPSFSQIDTLNNEKIISLNKAGVSVSVILKMVATAQIYHFKFNSDELIRFKANKVPDTVVLAMMEKSSSIPSHSLIQNEKVKEKEKLSESNNNFFVKKIADLKPGKCYVEEKNGGFTQLPECEIEFDKSDIDGRKPFFEPLGVAVLGSQVIYADGVKSTVSVANQSPNIYMAVTERLSGSDANTIVAFIKSSTIKKNMRHFPFDTHNIKLKKNTYAQAKIKIMGTSVIEASLEKKLPPGSYLIYVHGPKVGGFYELDIN